MSKINDIEIRQPVDKNEKWWFSHIAAAIEKVGFGSLQLKLTVKNGKVVNIKNTIEESHNINV